MRDIKISGMCVALAVVFLLAISGSVSADTIARWDYNDGNNIVDEGAGTQGYAVFSGSVTSTDQFSTVSNQAAYRINYGQISGTTSGVTWAVSTAGYTDVNLSLQLIRNNSSIPRFLQLYSFDGANWNALTGGDIDLGTNTNASNTWTNHAFDTTVLGLSSNNNADFVLGLFEAGEPTNSFTTAYHVMDNVTITGNPVPVPAAAWLLGSGLLGMLGLRRRFK